ncbi:hypothetical protein ACHAL6_11175 [Proteiniclasticum sp. C24MP]|uniref:hypothetical protein n=1 Tax=Proteiniclasticum sp. C24MP TaxID=3374101 RepID=UPI003755278C
MNKDMDTTRVEDDAREKEALGEKWEDLKNREPKNTSKEIKLLKKKIRYLTERVRMYEDELAELEGIYDVKRKRNVDEEGLDRLAELQRTVGDDHTRRI